MNQMWQRLAKVTHAIWVGVLKAQRVVMLMALCLSVVLMLICVLMRYVFEDPIVGAGPLAAYVAFWLYFIGASYSSYEHGHIAADISHLVFKNPRTYAKLRAIISFISFALLGVMIPVSLDWLVFSYTNHERSVATLFGSLYPVVYFQAAVTFGFVLMAFYSLVEFIQYLLYFVRKEPIPKEMFMVRKEIGSWM